MILHKVIVFEYISVNLCCVMYLVAAGKSEIACTCCHSATVEASGSLWEAGRVTWHQHAHMGWDWRYKVTRLAVVLNHTCEWWTLQYHIFSLFWVLERLSHKFRHSSFIEADSTEENSSPTRAIIRQESHHNKTLICLLAACRWHSSVWRGRFGPALD